MDQFKLGFIKFLRINAVGNEVWIGSCEIIIVQRSTLAVFSASPIPWEGVNKSEEGEKKKKSKSWTKVSLKVTLNKT